MLRDWELGTGLPTGTVIEQIIGARLCNFRQFTCEHLS